MYQILLDLEKCFFKLKYTSDRAWLNKTLHDDFRECGKSGNLFNKQETVEGLLSCTEDRDIAVYNFEYNEAGDNCWLAHYITKNNGDMYYRTSVWVKNPAGNIQLLFHQATLLNCDISLKLC